MAAGELAVKNTHKETMLTKTRGGTDTKQFNVST